MNIMIKIIFNLYYVIVHIIKIYIFIKIEFISSFFYCDTITTNNQPGDRQSCKHIPELF